MKDNLFPAHLGCGRIHLREGVEWRSTFSWSFPGGSDSKASADNGGDLGSHTMVETWVQFLAWEDPLEKEMTTHSNIFAWEIPRRQDPGGLQSTGLERIGQD